MDRYTQKTNLRKVFEGVELAKKYRKRFETSPEDNWDAVNVYMSGRNISTLKPHEILDIVCDFRDNGMFWAVSKDDSFFRTDLKNISDIKRVITEWAKGEWVDDRI